MWRWSGLLLIGALLLPGCAEGDAVQPQAQTGEDGVQATGRLDGSRVAVSSGEPEVVAGDCDPGDGLDDDLCMVVRTIDGVTLNLVIENPAVLDADGTVPVHDDPCLGPACDTVTGHAVVDVRVDGRQQRASAGTVTATEGDERVTGAFNLRFRDGDTLVGSFDLDLR